MLSVTPQSYIYSQGVQMTLYGVFYSLPLQSSQFLLPMGVSVHHIARQFLLLLPMGVSVHHIARQFLLPIGVSEHHIARQFLLPMGVSEHHVAR